MNSDFDSIMKQMLNAINSNSNSDTDTCSKSNNSGNMGQAGKNGCINLTPSQIVVLAGILGGVLSVESVLVDRHQIINIILTGSLKRKTDLDKMIEEIGSKSFSDVVSSIMNNIK